MRPLPHVVHERGAPRHAGRQVHSLEEQLDHEAAVVPFLAQSDERAGGGDQERRREGHHGVPPGVATGVLVTDGRSPRTQSTDSPTLSCTWAMSLARSTARTTMRSGGGGIRYGFGAGARRFSFAVVVS